MLKTETAAFEVMVMPVALMTTFSVAVGTWSKFQLPGLWNESSPAAPVQTTWEGRPLTMELLRTKLLALPELLLKVVVFVKVTTAPLAAPTVAGLPAAGASTPSRPRVYKSAPSA